MNLPNKLTVARLVMAPVFVVLMSFDSTACYGAAYVVFVVASITDYADGRIARARQLVTNFGKLMDPIADKVLVTSAFIMMMTVPNLSVPGWAVIAIIGREFLVTGARAIAAGDGAVIAANWAGKVKMLAQVGYVGIFLGLAVVYRLSVPSNASWLATFETALHIGSYWAAAAVALFTLWSGVQFAVLNWGKLKLGDL